MLVLPSMLLDPAPPVAVTVPPESFPPSPMGIATTEFAWSFVKKNMALFDCGEQGWEETLGIKYAASSKIWEVMRSILRPRQKMSFQ